MMKNKTIKDYPSVKFIVLLSLAISIFLHAAMFLSFWFGDGIIFQQIGTHKRPPIHLDGFLLHIVSTFILAFALYMYNMYIQKNIKRNNKMMLLLMIVGSVILTIIMSFIFTTLHPYILGHEAHKMPISGKVHIYTNALMRDFFVMMVVTLSWQLLVSNYRSRKIAVENESLIAENLMTRYDVLKNQMNPHFLFNSLNTLQSLIDIDKEKAKDYVQELSKVLRYSLQHFLVPERDKLVPLAAKDIAYIYIDLKLTKAVTFSGKIYYLNQNLDEMMSQLNPKMFFRANRQYIVSHEAIKDVSIWFGNKISLNLTVPTEEKIIVSKARVSDFKNWYSF